MKYLLSIVFLSFCLCNLSAQEKHFIFIQSDNNLPFYVSLNGKLYSSSAIGYVIIPKLAEGEYNFLIGFAQNAFPEQAFQFAINKKDLGFNLKNFGDKGWGLFNIESLDVTMSDTNHTTVAVKAITPNNAEQVDVFSFNKKRKDTLATQAKAKIVNTTESQPTIKNDESKSLEIKPETAIVASEKNKSIPVDTARSSVNNASVKAPAANEITKVLETKSADGLYLSYVDGKNTDTVNIIIPSQVAPASENNASPSDTVNVSASVLSKPITAKKSKKDDVKFLDIDMNSSKKDTVQVVKNQTQNANIPSNSNCKNAATEEDYAHLKRKMAMETTDEKMIGDARKVYRNKCFTTAQVKGLSTLFLSDEGRYKFFDASYLSVVDPDQYSLLQSEFIDPSFVTRFKALLQ